MFSDKRFGWKGLGLSLTLIGILSLVSASSVVFADVEPQMAENSTDASSLPVFNGAIVESEVGPETQAVEAPVVEPMEDPMQETQEVQAEQEVNNEPIPAIAVAPEQVVTPDMQKVSPERGVVGEVASRIAAPQVLERSVISTKPGKRKTRKKSLLSEKGTLSAGYVISNPTPSGTIVSNQEYWTSPLTGETVYIDIGTSQGVKVGDRFLVYDVNDTLEHSFTNREAVSHPVINEDGETNPDLIEYDLWHEGRDQDLGRWRNESNIYNKWFGDEMTPLGDMVRVVAVVTVYEPGPELSKARVTQFFAWFDVGSYLTPYPDTPPTPVIGKKPSHPISGYIIGSKEGAVLNGLNDIIYIDKGEQDSVQVGDILNVITVPFHQDIDTRYSIWAEEERRLLNEVIGELVVLSVQSKTATALITKSRDSILVGHVIESKR